MQQHAYMPAPDVLIPLLGRTERNSSCANLKSRWLTHIIIVFELFFIYFLVFYYNYITCLSIIYL